MTLPVPLPPTVESKAWKGSLTIGGTFFGHQASAVRIRPAHSSSGDPLYILCGNALSPDTVRTDTLVVNAVQDFDDPDGFVAYSWEHDGEDVEVVWRPNDVTGSVTYTGTVTIRAIEVGGDARTRLTTSAEWTSSSGFSPSYGA